MKLNTDENQYFPFAEITNEYNPETETFGFVDKYTNVAFYFYFDIERVNNLEFYISYNHFDSELMNQNYELIGFYKFKVGVLESFNYIYSDENNNLRQIQTTRDFTNPLKTNTFETPVCPLYKNYFK